VNEEADVSSIPAGSPRATTAKQAIQTGDVETLERLLREHPELATARLAERGCTHTLLHAVADWPGHFPNGPASVRALVDGGADVNAAFDGGAHAETPLHGAASSDDIDVLDALVEAGADVEAPGAVLGGGSAMSDAVGFGQWRAARRLLEHGAATNLWQAAALGLLDRVEAELADSTPSEDDVTRVFWQACHGGQRATAEYLLARGADLNWVGWNEQTPLDIAAAQGADDVVEWLRSRGGKSAAELSGDGERPDAG
jgi:uncharacterized protein